MVDYVAPNGDLNEEAITALIEAVKAQTDHAMQLAAEAWGADVFNKAQLDWGRNFGSTLKSYRTGSSMSSIAPPGRLSIFAQPSNVTPQDLQGRFAGIRAGDLVARLLGIPSDQRRQNQEADDRSAGYPLRRFAEFGLLPGYEFPSEPASLQAPG